GQIGIVGRVTGRPAERPAADDVTQAIGVLLPDRGPRAELKRRAERVTRVDTQQRSRDSVRSARAHPAAGLVCHSIDLARTSPCYSHHEMFSSREFLTSGRRAMSEPGSQENFLVGYDPRGYEPIAVTVDIVALTIRDGGLHVLL